MADTLSLYVVYDHPRDFPDSFVVRRHTFKDGGKLPPPQDGSTVTGPTADHWTADSLAAARALIPPGLFRLDRFAQDDDCIVEVWL